MDKKRRQTAIIEIITENEVETQGELSRLLSERGINATQATLSRDINELHITKCGERRQPLFLGNFNRSR